MKIIKIGMAELDAARSPHRIRSAGLGSCVGVTLYDECLKVGGMAHIMLPSSTLNRGELNQAKYADTAIPRLLKEMEMAGCNRKKLVAKLAGGSQMFAFSSTSDIMRIGPRNVEACIEALKKEGIPVTAEDTGGSWGRTIELDCESGMLSIKTVNQGTKEI